MPIMPETLAKYGNLQVPAIKNLDIITDNGERFLELRMLQSQDSYRAEVSVDLLYDEGDTVAYQRRLRRFGHCPREPLVDVGPKSIWMICRLNTYRTKDSASPRARHLIRYPQRVVKA